MNEIPCPNQRRRKAGLFRSGEMSSAKRDARRRQPLRSAAATPGSSVKSAGSLQSPERSRDRRRPPFADYRRSARVTRVPCTRAREDRLPALFEEGVLVRIGGSTATEEAKGDRRA